MTLLGFYDRNGDGLAVELSPEMATDIVYSVKDILDAIEGESSFGEVSEIRVARYAFDRVYRINRYEDRSSDFFALPEDEELFRVLLESTGIFLDIENGDPAVFWEIYDSHRRFVTPYLSLTQLDAIANNQPLPQE